MALMTEISNLFDTVELRVSCMDIEVRFRLHHYPTNQGNQRKFWLEPGAWRLADINAVRAHYEFLLKYPESTNVCVSESPGTIVAQPSVILFLNNDISLCSSELK